MWKTCHHSANSQKLLPLATQILVCEKEVRNWSSGFDFSLHTQHVHTLFNTSVYFLKGHQRYRCLFLVKALLKSLSWKPSRKSQSLTSSRQRNGEAPPAKALADLPAVPGARPSSKILWQLRLGSHWMVDHPNSIRPICYEHVITLSYEQYTKLHFFDPCWYWLQTYVWFVPGWR